VSPACGGEVVLFEQHAAEPDVHVGGAPHHAVLLGELQT